MQTRIKVYKVLFPVLIVLTLFSYWAGFALLIVNRFFLKDLPGYVIGRICIWEFVAVLVACFIAKWLIDKWGNVGLEKIGERELLTLHPNYGKYFGIYFAVATIVGIWQFWIFSLKF